MPIGDLEQPLAEFALLLDLLVDKVVNVEGYVALLLQMNVMDDDLFALAEPQDPTRSLVHQGRSPPGSREDDAVKVLEVETGARALNLREEHRVRRSLETHNMPNYICRNHGLCEDVLKHGDLSLTARGIHRGLRLGNNSGPCRLAHAAVIREHSAHTGLLHEPLAQDVHLLLKVTEDHVAVPLLLLLHDVDDGIGLGGVALPVRAQIRSLLLLALDVDLGVDADLAQPQQQSQHCEAAPAILLHQVLQLRRDTPLDAAIEERLVLRRKRDAMLFNDGGLGEHVGEQLTHLSRGPVERPVAHPRLHALLTVADKRPHLGVCEGDEAREVAGAIHDGRTGEKPILVAGELTERNSLLAHKVPQRVGLVADDAVEAHVKRLATAHKFVIVGDKHTTVVKVAANAAPVVLVKLVDGRALRSVDCGNPLLEHGEGGEHEGHRHGLVDHEADGRHGLAEPHVVTQESAAHLCVFLALNHPLDCGNLMRQ